MRLPMPCGPAPAATAAQTHIGTDSRGAEWRMSIVCTIFVLMKTIPILPGVTLRELRTDDAADIFAAIDGERTYLGRWLPFVQFTRCEEDSLRFVRSVLDAPYREAVFTIRDGGHFIGLIGFKSTDPLARTTEIGYWLREAWQGRGIVTTAVAALCRMAREELAMRTVAIKCATGNGTSNRIPQRLGFTLDRIERRAELLENGRYTDANVYLLHLTERIAPAMLIN